MNTKIIMVLLVILVTGCISNTPTTIPETTQENVNGVKYQHLYSNASDVLPNVQDMPEYTTILREDLHRDLSARSFWINNFTDSIGYTAIRYKSIDSAKIQFIVQRTHEMDPELDGVEFLGDIKFGDEAYIFDTSGVKFMRIRKDNILIMIMYGDNTDPIPYARLLKINASI
ncbi:MAG: hypothetical protein Q8M95_09650 [Candidatus Methanoperedens sp.]|nr:hypothetical protein [Candidatus Methanoperedens sp.]